MHSTQPVPCITSIRSLDRAQFLLSPLVLWSFPLIPPVIQTVWLDCLDDTTGSSSSSSHRTHPVTSLTIT